MGKVVIGSIECVFINDIGLKFCSRIDTGAKSCSLHAFDIKLLRPDIGAEISFKTGNEKGQIKIVSTKILSVNRIKSTNGITKRYSVLLKLSLKGITKKVKVTLADRSKMKCPLLIGRNFLNNDFLVDVSN